MSRRPGPRRVTSSDRSSHRITSSRRDRSFAGAAGLRKTPYEPLRSSGPHALRWNNDSPDDGLGVIGCCRKRSCDDATDTLMLVVRSVASLSRPRLARPVRGWASAQPPGALPLRQTHRSGCIRWSAANARGTSVRLGPVATGSRSDMPLGPLGCGHPHQGGVAARPSEQ